MSKFRVGDKVRVIEEGSHNQEIGAICEIIEIDMDGSYLADCPDGHTWYFGDDDIELVRRNFTKSDLQSGDIVTYRYGDKRTLIKKTFECTNFGKSTSILEHYNEDLTMKDGNKEMDIVKVERPVKYETVFERKEEILDEVEKRYLASVIRPFRDKVVSIAKWKNERGGYIHIELVAEGVNFPYFEDKTMYKGMEVNRIYTLEELGL